jgi:molybdopterin-containing oxidoreductase family membrane subunit
MTEREYELLDALTESFPGRALRDDWAGQAKRLMDDNS